MTDSQAAHRLLMRLSREMQDAIDAGDADKTIALALVPVKVWLETVLQAGDPRDSRDIKAEMVRRCAPLVNLGHCDEALRCMGFADGCIREARKLRAASQRCDGGGMSKPGNVVHET